jgi:hypothetical protein
MPDWPHSPTHRLGSAGAYMVTAATYQKQPLFCSAKRLRRRAAALHTGATRKFLLAGGRGW